MDLPPDQRLLHDDLLGRLAKVADEDALLRFMAEVLRTLLRRKGDAEFRVAVQDALFDGMLGRPFAAQRALAREVIGMVIAKRPEIALAWQALHPEHIPFRRRQADAEPAAPAPVPVPARSQAPAPAPAAIPPYEFAASEALVAEYVVELLDRRLAVFTMPHSGFPSAAYCHERPFFLFTPEFARVARSFVSGPLMECCRMGLERRVYRHADPAALADDERRRAVLTAKRQELWKIITEKLAKLAAAQKNAEAKLARAEGGGKADPGYKVVEIPVTAPRVYRILGVEFTLGTQTTTRKTRVPVKSPTQLDIEEIEALDLIGQLRDMAAAEGIPLPAAADFQLLRSLLEFDVKRFTHAVKEYSALAGHHETTRKYLFDRLEQLDQAFNAALADIVVVMLFYEHADGRFGFAELYDVCVGTGREKGAVVAKRPFVQSEVARRPRELAFQVREALRRRLDINTVENAVRLLLDCVEKTARARFRHEVDAALAVVSGFSLAFAGDANEPVFAAVGAILHDALSSAAIDRTSTLSRVCSVYGQARRGAA